MLGKDYHFRQWKVDTIERAHALTYLLTELTLLSLSFFENFSSLKEDNRVK